MSRRRPQPRHRRVCDALSGVPEDDRLGPWTAAEVGEREAGREVLEAGCRCEGGRSSSAFVGSLTPAHLEEAQTVPSKGRQEVPHGGVRGGRVAGLALAAEADRYGATRGHQVAPNGLADERLHHQVVSTLVGGATAALASALGALPLSRRRSTASTAARAAQVSALGAPVRRRRLAPVGFTSSGGWAQPVPGELPQLDRHVLDCRSLVLVSDVAQRVAADGVANMPLDASPRGPPLERVTPGVVGADVRVSDTEGTHPFGKLLSCLHPWCSNRLEWIRRRRFASPPAS